MGSGGFRTKNALGTLLLFLKLGAIHPVKTAVFIIIHTCARAYVFSPTEAAVERSLVPDY